MAVRKGTYVLFVRFDAPRDVAVGALGMRHIPKGTYCYVGSALAGLDQRLSRHLSREKRARWHIDYLTSACDSSYAYESAGDRFGECDLARLVEANGAVPFMEGFGCSDCRCRTHLFRAKARSLISVLKGNGLERFAETEGRPRCVNHTLLSDRMRCDGRHLLRRRGQHHYRMTTHRHG